jgi:hypothetical protein
MYTRYEVQTQKFDFYSMSFYSAKSLSEKIASPGLIEWFRSILSVSCVELRLRPGLSATLDLMTYLECSQYLSCRSASKEGPSFVDSIRVLDRDGCRTSFLIDSRSQGAEDGADTDGHETSMQSEGG